MAGEANMGPLRSWSRPAAMRAYEDVHEQFTKALQYVVGSRRNTIEQLQQLISELEQHKAAIDNALAALRQVSGATEPKRRGRPPGSRAGQRKRWRPPKKQVRLTAEGRQRLAEAMKKRWAVKRASKAAVKRRAKKAP